MDARVITHTVSDGAKALVALGFGIDEKAEAFASLHTQLLALYLEQIESTQSTLYPGMENLLDSLEQAGYSLGNCYKQASPLCDCTAFAPITSRALPCLGLPRRRAR